ncbi:MAG: hypothetical protein HYV53_03710 [Parcubacteria group bacterium]|nr:hypothetical protein [Parcubacteria group bacterium]
MSDINFLDNKKRGDGQKPESKDDKKETLAWSNPEKEVKSRKNSAFSFLPFTNKPASVNKNFVAPIDKSKLKRSREEILNLIKQQKNLKPPIKEKGEFLRTLGEKLKKPPAPKQVLIDYQRVFNQEIERKNQTGEIFKIKPEIRNKIASQPASAVKKFRNNWLSQLIKKLFKSKIIAWPVSENKTAKIVKLMQAEEIKPTLVQPTIQPEKKSAEVKETKIVQAEPIHHDKARQRVLETNLIQGELAIFFNWRAKAIVFAGAILAPILAVATIYYGLVFYEKSSQAKNLAQAQKFAELKQNIAAEEAGLKEILAFQAKLKTVSQIFAQHIYWTNFFKFLEDNTMANVYFIDFKGNTSGNYTMNAATVDYRSIDEQVDVFRNNKKITAASTDGGELVSGDQTNKSRVKFILNFSVLKSIFTE